MVCVIDIQLQVYREISVHINAHVDKESLVLETVINAISEMHTHSLRNFQHCVT